jgi:hypothetical protein
VCGSDAIATGEDSVDTVLSEGPQPADLWLTRVHQELWLHAWKLHCPVCNLRLDSDAEMRAAGIETSWALEDADPSHSEQALDDADAGYDRQREERGGL